MNRGRKSTRLFLVVGLLVAVAFCVVSFEQTPAREKPECQCFRRMTMLWATGVSHVLETKKAGNETIETENLAPFLRSGAPELLCPASEIRYPAFSLETGPRCSAHGAARDILAKALADPDHPCRSYAVTMLGVGAMSAWWDSPSGELIEALIFVVRKDEGELRTKAAETLEHITRQSLGENALAWQSWWATNQHQFRLKR